MMNSTATTLTDEDLVDALDDPFWSVFDPEDEAATRSELDMELDW